MIRIKKNCFVVVLLLPLVLSCAALMIKRASMPKIKDAQYIGSNKCAQEKCHPKQHTDIINTSHAKLFEQESPEAPACELCHGKGSLHEANPKEPDLIFSFNKLSPKEASEVCLSCHTKGSLTNWFALGHYQKDISCVKCHISHGNTDKKLLKAADPEICYTCHPEIKHKFTLTFKHKFEKDGFRCANCHKSHEEASLWGDNYLKLLSCQDCHQKYTKKHNFEHEPVKKDCMDCHEPHGSEHAGLCQDEVNSLCKTCHSFITHRAFFIARAFSNAKEKLEKGQCIKCHKKIHGSKYEFLLKHKGPSIGRPFGQTPAAPGSQAIEQRRNERQLREKNIPNNF